MAFRTPRDEREWRAMVERGLRESRTGIRAAAESAVGVVIVENNLRHPTAPIELTFQTALYMSLQGRSAVRFVLDFPDVTKATDGTDITVAQYELWGKPVSAALLALTTDAVTGLAAPGATLPGLAGTPANKAISAIERPWALVATSVESFFRVDGFQPGSLWDFRARAIGSGMATPGNWSTVIQVQMLEDTTPPSQPTAPILSVSRGTITARWDGMAVTGAMPADFRYVILAHGTDTSPTMEVARFGRGGGFKVIADIPYYDPQFFRLKAVDESGNESPWSEQAVAYTTPLVDRDIILSTIDAAQTHLININAGVSILPNTIITEHLVVTEEMTAALANFLHIRTDMLDANEIWADQIWVGLADAVLVRADMFEGKVFTGGTFTGTLFQTDVEALTGLKLDLDGLAAWNEWGVETFRLDAATGDLLAVGEFRTALSGPRIRMFADTTSGTIEMFPDNTAQRARFWSGPSQGGFTTLLQNFNASNTLMSELSLNSSGGVEIQASLSRTLTLDNPSDYSEIVFGKTTPRFVGSVGRPQQLAGAFGLLAGPGLDIRIATADSNKGMYAVPIYQITSSASGNVVIDANGLLLRSTSASKYKLAQREMVLPESLLDIKVKDWVDRAQAEAYSRALDNPVALEDMTEAERADFDAINMQRFPGAIAEDVIAAGGEQFVVFGTDGMVEGLMYDRLALAQVSLLKNQVDDLRARVDALEGV